MVTQIKWKFLFRILLILFVAVFLGWLGLQAGIFWTNKTIADRDTLIAQQNKELSAYTSLTGFTKFTAVKELEGLYTDISWTNRIQKVIAMLDQIQSLDVNQDQTLILSDFNVNLDKISLKGRVSSLLLLYYSFPEKGIVSLIDRFKQLDFISDMHIKDYTKNNGFFSFVLEANVQKNAK